MSKHKVAIFRSLLGSPSSLESTVKALATTSTTTFSSVLAQRLPRGGTTIPTFAFSGSIAVRTTMSMANLNTRNRLNIIVPPSSCAYPFRRSEGNSYSSATSTTPAPTPQLLKRSSNNIGTFTRNSSYSSKATTAAYGEPEIHYNGFYDTAGRNENEVEPPDNNDVDLIILNSPYEKEFILETIWSKARTKVCADGGANQLFDSIPKGLCDVFIPDYICGDLDSVRPEVMQYYKKRGTRIVHMADQNSNDLQKSIRLLLDVNNQTNTGGMDNDNTDNNNNNSSSSSNSSPQLLPQNNNKKRTIVVAGGFGGRFDQEMSNVNAMFLFAKECKIVMWSNICVAFLLQPGRHIIKRNIKFESPQCGLIPLGSQCRNITTTGLKWNLENASLGFGHLVSSSNELVGDTATVETSDPILWTTVLWNGY